MSLNTVHFIPRPAQESLSSLDFGHLDRLQDQVRRNRGPAQARDREVAQQFEALLLAQLLKQARQTSTQEGGLFDSQAMRLVQGMQDDQRALDMADPGVGLAQALLEQIRSAREGTPGAAALAPADAARAAATLDAPAHVRTFVDRMGAAAQYAAEQSGLPASLILSQAALESGWGRREILHEDGRSSHNLFGIKATGNWEGAVVNVLTTEYTDGEARKLEQPFRAYDSYAESFADYARLITGNRRYRAVLDAASPQDAARRIQAAGYATDPGYADKLIAIMAYFEPQKA